MKGGERIVKERRARKEINEKRREILLLLPLFNTEKGRNWEPERERELSGMGSKGPG